MTKPDEMTYAQALEQMRTLSNINVRPRWSGFHDVHAERAASALLCAWLRQQGYDELVELWERVPKWYA